MTTSVFYARLVLVMSTVLITTLAGCAVDPRADDGNADGDEVGVVSMAVSSSNLGAVHVRWWQAKPLGSYIHYKLNWKSVSLSGEPADSGTREVYWFDGVLHEFPDGHTENVFTADVYGLQERFYSFELVVYRDGQTDPVFVHSIHAAPANRYEFDIQRPGEPIRLYESGSAMGSGLIINPAQGGPTTVTREDAPFGSVQLVLLPEDSWPAGKFVLASVVASPEFGTHISADRTATTATSLEVPLHFERKSISRQVDAGMTSLDDWYSEHGRINAITFSASEGASIWLTNGTGGSGLGYGFFMEFGEISGFTGTDFRQVCRVFVVPNADGSILRGTAPNRYVELHITVGFPGIRWS